MDSIRYEYANLIKKTTFKTSINQCSVSESSETHYKTVAFNIRIFISVWCPILGALSTTSLTISTPASDHISVTLCNTYSLGFFFSVGIPSILKQSLLPCCSYSSLATRFLIFSFLSSKTCFCKDIYHFQVD